MLGGQLLPFSPEIWQTDRERRGRGVQSAVHWGSPHTRSKAQPPQPLLPQTALPQTGQSSDVSRRVNYRPLDGAYLRWL